MVRGEREMPNFAIEQSTDNTGCSHSIDGPSRTVSGKVVCHCSICGNDLVATTGSHGQLSGLYRIAKLISLPER
jgi:hypothetical protein